MLLEGFLKTLQNILPVVMWFGRALAGVNPELLKLFLLFQILKRMKIFDILMTTAFGFGAARIAAEQYTLQMHSLDLQMSNLKAKKITSIGLMKLETLELKRSAMAAQYTAQAFQQLAGAAMGFGFGIYMAITGMTREARVMGGLITVIMSLVLAFRLLAIARAASAPWAALAQIGAAAAVAGGIATLGYGLVSPIPDVEMPEYDFSMPTIPTAQGGMRVVGGQGPQMIMAHPGEQISSANKEAGGGGAVIEIRDSYFFDWDSFVTRMREDIGVENIKELRRYK
jgi:hypothetical protein